MKFYLLAILVLTVQEVVSTNALLLEALHGHYALWIIHGIFVAATVFDIWIGYRIGMYTKKRLTRGKVYDFAEKMSARFNRSLGKNGRRELR